MCRAGIRDSADDWATAAEKKSDRAYTSPHATAVAEATCIGAGPWRLPCGIGILDVFYWGDYQCRFVSHSGATGKSDATAAAGAVVSVSRWQLGVTIDGRVYGDSRQAEPLIVPLRFSPVRQMASRAVAEIRHRRKPPRGLRNAAARHSKWGRVGSPQLEIQIPWIFSCFYCPSEIRRPT